VEKPESEDSSQNEEEKKEQHQY